MKSGTMSMTHEKGMAFASVEEQHLVELPDREAMSLVNANLALPINLALAANVLSDGSIAQAGAFQQTPIDQGAGGFLQL